MQQQLHDGCISGAWRMCRIVEAVGRGQSRSTRRGQRSSTVRLGFQSRSASSKTFHEPILHARPRSLAATHHGRTRTRLDKASAWSLDSLPTAFHLRQSFSMVICCPSQLDSSEPVATCNLSLSPIASPSIASIIASSVPIARSAQLEQQSRRTPVSHRLQGSRGPLGSKQQGLRTWCVGQGSSALRTRQTTSTSLTCCPRPSPRTRSLQASRISVCRGAVSKTQP